MSDIFGIAKSGLQAYKEGLATTGQNIANVGNENYARREANLKEVRSSSADVLSISPSSSYGVKVDGITRAFDRFIDIQLQKASSGLSFSTSQTLILENLEQVLRPSEATVANKLHDFFASLSTVSQDPSDLAARHIAVDAGQAVVASINNVANGINDLRKLVTDTITGNVKDFNNIIKLLGSVQREILGNTSPKTTPNNLLDQRDTHLKSLSEIADISVDYLNNGAVKVTLGTSGQGQTLVEGLTVKNLKHQIVDGASKIFIDGLTGGALTKLQIQSGEIAGNLAADITLASSKKSLDDLTKSLVLEFNEAHRFGVDLNGDNGKDFFSLEAINIVKNSSRESSSQLRVEGNLASRMGESLTVTYDPEKEFWGIKDSTGNILKEFKGNAELDGLRFNIEGRAALGDSFSVKFSNNASENLQIKINDGKKIAASSFYLVEPSGANLSNTRMSLERFSEIRDDNLPELNAVLNQPRDAANSVSFVSDGALGYLKDVDSINNLAALKSQAKIQFSAPLSGLDANSKLKVTLGSTEHIFSIGNYISGISSYAKIADTLNSGGLKSDTNAFSFSDLGLFAGGNKNNLTISSAAQPPYSSFQKLNSGSLNNISGIKIPADVGTADIKIFTREGFQLTGKPLSQEEVNTIIDKTNGFSEDAIYSAQYTAIGSNNKYIGAEITRLTTDGAHVKKITGIGFTDNLKLYAANSFPSARSGMPSAVTITTSAGRTANFTPESGMMAGQIADKFNKDLGKLGVEATATNKVEIFGIPNGRLKFDLLGDNSDPSSIDVTISNNEMSGLVADINSKKDETGITAFVTGSGAILLVKDDGNDISLKNFSIASGSISARQIDKFGEKIQSSPVSISDGKHIISGGQVELRSPSTFSLTIGGATQSSSLSSFDDGFIEKSNNIAKNQTDYNFKTSSFIDGNLLDENRSIAVASSSSYAITLTSDNANQNISAVFQPRAINEFSSAEISKNIVSEIRKNAPKTKFVGDDFTLSDGFPATGSTAEFQLGEQKYVATLNTSLEYKISGSTVTIGSKTYSFSEALEQIVAASTFSVSGPEKDRLVVGFERNGSSFRFFAIPKDGVLSGHALVAASSNSLDQKNAFHISTSSGAELLTNEIDLTQADKAGFAELVIGANSYSLSFATAGDTISSNPALPAGVSISKVSTGTNKAKMKISVAESVADKNIRLKATNNSTSFGFVTSSSQVTIGENNFSLSNYNNERVETTSSVSSLADEIVSVSGLKGEDLIVVSSGTRKPTIIGKVNAVSQELNAREMTAKVDAVNPKLVNIFDTRSGDLLGSRSIGGDNNFLFRDFDWKLDGTLNAGDEFKVLTSNVKKDDGTNLDRLIALSSFSESSGKGGYSEKYNSLVTAAGFQLRASEQNLVNSKAAHDIAVDRKSEFSGVDLDTEAARLLEQQQAYQALARVLSTAKELLDTLLRSM